MEKNSLKTDLKKFEILKEEAFKKAQDSSGLNSSGKWFNLGKGSAYGDVIHTLKKKKYWK